MGHLPCLDGFSTVTPSPGVVCVCTKAQYVLEYNGDFRENQQSGMHVINRFWKKQVSLPRMITTKSYALARLGAQSSETCVPWPRFSPTLDSCFA